MVQLCWIYFCHSIGTKRSCVELDSIAPCRIYQPDRDFDFVYFCNCAGGFECKGGVIMALSLIIQQHLEKVAMVDFYNLYKTEWDALAERSHDFIHDNFPQDYEVHPEDVCKILVTLIEVNDRMNDFLNQKRLREKYWIKYFCDYILDQCWTSIHP